MAAPKTCGFCLEPLTDCCCDDEPGGTSGLTAPRVRTEGGDDPGEPDPELYQVNERAERM